MQFVIDNWSLFLIAIAAGGLLLWPMIQNAMAGSLTPALTVQLINREKANVVDVSETEEYAAGHLVGSRNIPLGELESKLAQSVKNKGLPLILVCPSGARAQRGLAIAKKLGYDQAQAMAGGLKAWKEAKLPLEKKI